MYIPEETRENLKTEENLQWQQLAQNYESKSSWASLLKTMLQQEERRFAWEEETRLKREREEHYMKYRQMQSNSIRYFMMESTNVCFDPKERTPSAVLYDGYCRWCQQNKLFPESIRAFCLHLKKNAFEYRIAPTNFTWQGRHIRGFRGLALLEEEEHTSHT